MKIIFMKFSAGYLMTML